MSVYLLLFFIAVLTIPDAEPDMADFATAPDTEAPPVFAANTVVLAALATTMLFYNNVLTVTMIKEKAWSAAQKVGNAIKVATVATTKLLNAALTALQLTYTRLRYGADAYRLAMEKAKLASITNPWAALAMVLTVVGVAVYSAVKAWQAHKKAIHDNLQSVKEANAIKKNERRASAFNSSMRAIFKLSIN